MPDYVLSTQAGTVVLNPKYKDTGVTAAAAEGIHLSLAAGASLRLSTRDIYQIIAYGQHDRFRPCSIGLVYPVALLAGEVTPAPQRIEGFSSGVDVFLPRCRGGGGRERAAVPQP